MEIVNFNRLPYFAAVVDVGSFTKAAERLGITKTVVSQQVARLEEELRCALLSRTTRRVEPTGGTVKMLEGFNLS
jgi:DNA-binding transcriptional LysR family regulator